MMHLLFYLTLIKHSLLLSKQKILLLIPLGVIAGFLIYTWIHILFTDEIAQWRHYTGLILFIPVIILFFSNFKWSLLALGIYLIAGMFYLLSVTPAVLITSGINIGSLSIPFFHPLMFVIFILYFFLNFNTLVDIKLDWEEAREAKRNKIPDN